MSGKKGRSGRKPRTLDTEEGKRMLVNKAPLFSRVIIEAAEAGNLTAALFAYDQIHGRARQYVESTHQITVTLDPGQMAQIRAERSAGMAELEAMSLRYLHPGQDVVEGEVINE